MELSRYLDILRRRMVIILLVTSVVVTVVVATGFFTSPRYEAMAIVRVMEDVGVKDYNIINDSYGRLTSTYGAIIKSSPVLQEAMNRVGKSVPVDELRQTIKSDIEPGTELMSISVTSSDPKFAQDMANTLAALLVEYVQQVNIGDNAGSRQIEDRLVALETELEQDRQRLAGIVSNNAVPDAEVDILKSTIEFKEDSYRNMLLLFHSTRLGEDLRARSVTIITPAAQPNFPANGFGFREVGLGLIIGLFSGLGLALALENLDTRVYSSQQLENFTHLPVLATVPSGALPVSSLEDESSPRTARLRDAYRLLASNLYTLKEQMPLQTIVISSAVAQEGKSTVAVNLSQVLAERGQTVFLIETDMRHPSLSKKLGLNGHGSKEGLSNLLSEPGNIDSQKFSEVLNITEQPSLFLLEGGSKVANPAALLASPRMNELLKYLGDQSQLTLIDSPPILGMADVSVVASKVDGVLLVVAQGASRREEITAAIKQLHSARSQVLGLVFIQKNGGNKVYN